MTSITDPPSALLPNPLAPDVYADAYSGILTVNGNLRITFETRRSTHNQYALIQRVTCARIIIPGAEAEIMCKAILGFLEKRRAQPQAPSDSSRTLQ